MQPLSTDEVLRRATGLLALGNTPARVRAALQDMGAAPDQIDEAMAAVEARTQQKHRADTKYLWWLGGATVAMMGTLICVAMAFTWQPGALSSPVEQAGDAPAAAQPAGQPQELPQQVPVQAILTNIPIDILPRQIPTDISPEFMASTPVVIRGINTRPESCPTNEIDAARMFGGKADDWAYDSATSGWTMTNVGAPVTITVPDEMVAGYLTISESIEMVRVDGPATIENVNFIAISCP